MPHKPLSLFWSLVSPSLIKAFELIGMVEHNMYTEDGMPACCLSVRKANESLAWQQHKKGLLWEGGREGGFLLMILRVIDAAARIHCCGIGSRALPIT